MVEVTHLVLNSRVGYFLWLNERIDTTNTAKEIAIIAVSNTDMATPPFLKEVSRPPLSYLYYYYSIIPF
jgi:hypothetical protein